MDEMIPELEEVQFKRSRQKKRRRRLVQGLALLVLLIVIAVIIVVTKAVISGGTSCSDSDGFNATELTISDSETRVLQYRFIEKEPGRRFYNFEEAKNRCKDLNSELWEVLGGENEWNLFYEISIRSRILGPPGSGLWLNGIPAQKCEEYPAKDCVEKKAQEGQGLPVKWLSSNTKSTYSRLTGWDEAEDEKCLIVLDGLWSTEDCGSSYWALCVRRNC